MVTVQDQLRNVQHVHAPQFAFAAVLGDGALVAWGNPNFGGDTSAVKDQLKSVEQIQATCGAFAALLAGICHNMRPSILWWQKFQS